MKEMISADIKESTCRVQEANFDEEQMQNIPNVSYELPDGQEIQVDGSLHKRSHFRSEILHPAHYMPSRMRTELKLPSRLVSNVVRRLGAIVSRFLRFSSTLR
jgi:hypothetical protein